MAGEAALFGQRPAEGVNAARAGAEGGDGDGGGGAPCRVTIVDEHGSLVTTGVQSVAGRAARPGVLYVRDGWAMVGVPAGKYTLYAGRGFEYSLATERVELKAGDSARRRMEIRRVVPTDGYVSCDTH